MKFLSLLMIAALFGALGSVAATTTKAAKKSTSKKTAATKTAAKTSAKTAAHTKTGAKNAKKTPAVTWRNRQQSPTPDRYREIQQALADKGYLKSEPTGVWDASSTDAMQRFQSDQKLPPTGKITAASLIGLGLGAKSAGAAEAQPAKSGTPSPPETPGAPKTSDN